MAQIGSSRDIISQSNTGLFDDLGNSVVSGNTGFAASPLGVAARSQALYGIPNPNFNLTPPDANAAIDNEANPLPYWTLENESSGVMSATANFDATTETWSVQLDPGTAAIDSTLTLTTRSYLLTDDNLSLRQRALAVLEKSGTAGTTTSQWNLQLSATYYSATGAALSTAIIGTALDTATWTSFAGTTTPGGSAINSSAQYVDLTFTMTATAAVTGSAKATIKSLILTTSTPAAGGGSFLVADTFTSSGTWTRPTGVNYLVAVVAVGAGGGGGGGGLQAVPSGTARYSGGGGGGGANWVAIREVYVGDVGSVSVGVGAAGAGGSGTSFTKAAGVSGSAVLFGANGGAGGATTFGTYLSVPGGGGGTAGSTANRGGGTAGGSATLTVLNNDRLPGANGGSSFTTAVPGTGLAGSATAFVQLTYTPVPVAGAAGVAAVGTANTASTTISRGTFGAAGSAGFGAGGGGGGGANYVAEIGYTGAVGGNGGGGGGGGGLHIFASGTATPGTSGNITGTAGNGGNAGSVAGAGGGGGGSLSLITDGTSRYNPTAMTLQSGAGGSGSGGVVYVIYVG